MHFTFPYNYVPSTFWGNINLPVFPIWLSGLYLLSDWTITQIQILNKEQKITVFPLSPLPSNRDEFQEICDFQKFFKGQCHFFKGTIKTPMVHCEIKTKLETNWGSVSRKGAMLIQKRCEDPFPTQQICITSRNRRALTMCYLWRFILCSESIPIALQLIEKKAPTSMLFRFYQKLFSDFRNS